MSKIANDLMQKGYLKSDRVIAAFSELSRIEFVPDEFAESADADIALPIGFGQTISQPMTVAFMLELLDLKKGHNVLDVGSGSGWVSSLLSYIVGSEGHVTSLEIIPELCKIGEENADKYRFVQKGILEFHNLNAQEGYSKNAPYDRIIVSASAEEIPRSLKDQLIVGGKMVIPIQNTICFVQKVSQTDFKKEEFSGFSFVPFIKKYP